METLDLVRLVEHSTRWTLRAGLGLVFGLIFVFSGTTLMAQTEVFNFQDELVAESLPVSSVPLDFQFGDVPPAPELPYMANDEAGGLLERVASLEAQIQSLEIGSCATYSSTCEGIELYAGAEAIWAKPHFKDAISYSETNTATGQQTLHPVAYGYDVAPRVWLGLKNNAGIGIRGSYWLYDESGGTTQNSFDGTTIYGAHVTTALFPANIYSNTLLTTLQTQNDLKAEIYDFYGTVDSCVNGIELSMGAGLRYARLRQNYHATVVGQLVATSTLDWSRDFDGVGPSVMFEGKKQIGSSPLSIVASGGGAVLFGSKSINRSVVGDQSPQPASPFFSLQDSDEIIGVGDLSLGIEWAATLPNGTVMSIRNSYQGQFWAESGDPTLGFLGFEGYGVSVELSR